VVRRYVIPALLLGAVAVVVSQTWPDIVRYLKIRQM
jgi:hypothetical protein